MSAFRYLVCNNLSLELRDSRPGQNRRLLQPSLIERLPRLDDQRLALLGCQMMSFTHGTRDDGPHRGLGETDDMGGERGDVCRARRKRRGVDHQRPI